LDECIELAQNPFEKGSSKRTEFVAPGGAEDQPYFEPIVQPLPALAAQLPTASGVLKLSRPPERASDSARLEKLRARLNSRKHLDETLERSLRKRSLT
jgi:hypothetical protein